jgi:excisionase family DNA binding protein
VRALTPNPIDDALLLKVEDSARILQTGRSTVFKLIATGELPAIKIGRTTRIPRAAIEKFVSERIAAEERRA